MKSSNINIRVDKELKEKCEKIYESLGINMSIAINLFLNQTIRVNGIPFEIKAPKIEETKVYENNDIILELLNIVDDLERAIKLDDNILDDEVSKFLSGIKMIYTRLISILESFDVKEIDALNKEFNPMYHQGVLTAKVEGVEPNIVVEVLQKGYMYKDKVIRPVMVKVSE